MSIADVVVIGIVVLCLAGIVWYYVRKRKSGASGCSCGCSDCPSSASCHPDMVHNKNN